MLGIALPAILAIEFIDPTMNLGQWQAAAFQAEGIANRHGGVYWYLTLLCGFWVLFSSQLGGMDGIGRRWSDMIWTGSQPERESNTARFVWMATAAIVGIGLIVMWFSESPLSGTQLPLVAAFLFGVPTAIWVIRQIAARMQVEHLEARVLTPLTLIYLVSVLGCVAMSALKIGQSIEPDGAVTMLVEWRTTVTVFLLGTAWLVGSAFVLARNMPPHNVYKIYYLIIGMYITWCCIAMQIARPLTMILIMSNIAGFLLAVTALHTLYVNRRFLPPALQPRWWKQLALLACSGWYFFMSFMALDARVNTQVGFSIRGWFASWFA
jgi:hypothetical protein